MIKFSIFALFLLILYSCDTKQSTKATDSNATQDALDPIQWTYIADLPDSLLTKVIADSIYDSYLNAARNNTEPDINALFISEAFYLKHGDSCRLSRIAMWRSIDFHKSGQIDSAMEQSQKALQLFHPVCDSIILISIHSNRTNLYMALHDFDKVIELANQSIALWKPEWKPYYVISAIYTNKAIAQVYKGDLESGLNTFHELLQTAIQEEDEVGQMDAYTNLGTISGIMYQSGSGEHYMDSVFFYNLKALDISKVLGQSENIAILYTNLARIKMEQGEFSNGFDYLDSASKYADAGQYLHLAINIAQVRSELYKNSGEMDLALSQLYHHIKLKDSMLNIDKLRAISEMQEKYERELNERQIKELEVANLNSELKKEQLEKMRNVYFFSGLGVFLIAGFLWGRLHLTRKAAVAIQKEKDISENLLLNILPFEVAEELKSKGEAGAKLFDQVTVLFTDFKGFTELAEKLTPEDLVHDLHKYFSEFDNICEKYGIEKIKTIGDAYMAAGGLPTPNTTHASDLVNAALEMAKVVEKGKAQKISQGLPCFEIRIGIHTGPVVAGIVGVKKFQYDIWGDTVNTASRVESSGEVGKVNITQATFELVKDQFNCVHRGKIHIKGKGDMDMYYVEESSRF